MPVSLTRLQWLYFHKVFFFFNSKSYRKMPFVQGTEVTPTSSLSYKKPPCCTLCDHFRDTALKVPHTGCCLNLLLESNSQSEDGGLKGKRDKIIWFRQWMNDVV